MKTIVLFKTKYNSSKQYALWISEELGCNAQDIQASNLQELLSYDAIVYVGGLYAGGVLGFAKIKENLEKLKHKHLVLCMVGMTNPNEQDKYLAVFKQNVPEEYRTAVKPFALRGNQLFSKMSLLHKLMMRMPKAMAEKIPTEQRTQEEQQFIDNFGKDIYFAKKENIKEVITYIQGLKDPHTENGVVECK